MIQEVMTEPGKIIFHEIPDAVAEPGKILIKMRRIGICGSDVHVWHGKHPFTPYPVTQGHEVAGEVVGIGEGVEGFSIGQKVTVQPQVVCGKCYPCTHGKYNLCEELKVMGFQTTGMASELFAAPAHLVLGLPENMTYDQGCLIEPLAVAVHAVKRYGYIEGADVVVEGAGPIGNLVAQTAKGMGAKRVLVTSHGGVRMQKAIECGADMVINTREKNLGEAMLEFFGPDKADVIFDCAGNDATMGDAIRYARKGSTIILVAVYSGMANVDLAVLNDHELDLNTTMMYREEDYIDAIRLVNEGKVKLEPLMSNHFPFSRYADAYRYIDENKTSAMKVIVDVDDLEGF